MHTRIGDVGVVKHQAAEMVELGAEVVALAHALQIGDVDAVGLQDRIEVVEAPEALVAFNRDVPAVAPPRRKRELALGLDRPAPAQVVDGGRGVVVDGGELDRVLAVGQPVAPLALPQHAVVGEVARMQREVGVGSQREVVGHFDRVAERRGVAVAGHQEARLPLHRRVGMLEVGQIEHRHAKQLELRILIGERGRLLIVNDPRRAEAPQRRHARIVLARRKPAAFELGDIALAADGLVGGNARVVLRHHAQGLDERIAEIVERFEPVGPGDGTVRVLELRIALRDQLVEVLVVDDLVGGQDEVVVVDLDIALRDDAIALGVVDELVGLHVEGLRAIDLRLRAEHAARGFRERTFRRGLRDAAGSGPAPEPTAAAGARRPSSRPRHSQQRRRKHPSQPPATAAKDRRSAARVVRYQRSTHHSAVLLV